MSPEFRRIAGIHVLDDGVVGAVWLAHDPATDVLHVYDACLFRREVLPVIAEGINARGRWIPVAWTDKEWADKLLMDYGCSMEPEPSDDTESVAEVISRDLWSRIRSGRFKVDRRLKEFRDEFETFTREDSKVPRNTHPLMAATRHAMDKLEYAKAEQTRRASTKNYPDVAIY